MERGASFASQADVCLVSGVPGFLLHDSASKMFGPFLFCLPFLVDFWEFLTSSSLLI